MSEMRHSLHIRTSGQRVRLNTVLRHFRHPGFRLSARPPKIELPPAGLVKPLAVELSEKLCYY